MDFGYNRFLSRYGLTESGVQRIMAELPVPVPNEASDSVFCVQKSTIGGLGSFCQRDVAALEVFPVSAGEVRFNLARYVNHSDSPNATFWMDRNGDGWLTILFDLERGTEVFLNYNDNMEKLIAFIGSIPATPP